MTQGGSRHSGAGERNGNPDAIADTLGAGAREAPPTEADTTDTLAGDDTVSGGAAIAASLEVELQRRRSAQASALTRGAPIGRFIVIERIGAGGMGEVLAAYDPELDRRVAIKLLRSDAAGAKLSALAHKRLLREAQAMAKLSHPNVITVYEVGTLESRVFIAMEFVDGCTLSSWMRQKRGCWREIVDTFVRAGRGLAAAHAAGLVHRDFKPDNVLVGDDGRVRVTDFGLVAAAGEAPVPTPDPEQSSHSPLAVSLTRTGAVMGTPMYMAPEQHRGQPVDGRADQFSFCVALYEALYGERPFSGASLSELQESVTSGEVRVAPRDTAVPSWLRAVLLRGLRTRPEERYANMDPLLEALERDPTAVRRRWGIGLTGVALAAVAVLLVLRSAGDRPTPCRDPASRLAGAWDEDTRAQLREAFNGTGRGYASDTAARVESALDAYARTWAGEHTRACEATYVRGEQSEKLMDLRMRCLDRRRQELGALTQLLGRKPDREVMDRAVRAVFDLVDPAVCADVDALTAARPPPDDPKVRSRVKAIRASIDEAYALLLAGKYDDALDRAKVLAAEAREVDYRQLEGEALWLLASAQKETGAATEARATLGEVIEAAAEAHDDALLAHTWIKIMVLVAQDLGRNYEGQTLVPVAEAAVARAGKDAGLRADLYQGVGGVLFSGGQFLDAQRYLLRALEIRQQTFATDLLGISRALGAVGDVYEELGEFDKAAENHRRALSLAEKALGPEHPDLVFHLYSMGLGLQERGELDEARTYLERALAIFEKKLGPEHPLTAYPLTSLSDVYLKLGRVDDATVFAERAVRIREAKPGDAADLAESRLALAEALWTTRRDRPRALALAEQARDAYADIGEAQAKNLAAVKAWLAERGVE